MSIKHLTLRIAITALTALSLTAVVSNRTVDDWPQWRGANRDGKSAERGLLKTWPQGGPKLVWQASGVGEGYSSFSVAHGKVYTLGARGRTEYVVAFDEATGRKVWEVPHGERFSNDRGDGPRGTPTVDGAQLYAFGASGDLSALDAASGKVLWKINVLQRFGGGNITWGLSESPLVLRDRIIVNAGGPRASIVAVNKKDGSDLWRSQGDPAGYSSGILHEVGGIPQGIFFTGQRVVGIDTRDGRLLWSYNRVSNRTANVATPIAQGNRVFLSSDYGTGAALLELSASGKGIDAREVYFTNEMRNHHASSVLIGDHLYGFSGNILTAMKFDTGVVAWRDRSVGKGSVIFADDRLYLFGENGAVGLAEANPAGYREHGRFQLRTGSLPTWSHPVVANGKLYLRDQDTIYAYDVRAR
jgi:outer membrane protein assembly factor BamB